MDKEIKKALELETKRQSENIELIASENYVSNEVLNLQGSILTNKYAEGYSSKRYYGGCEYIDIIENLAVEYACKLFDVKYANVQPHSGSSANMAVYRALLNHGDKVMGMNLSNGGHLTHGHRMSFSGQDYEIISYDINLETELIDYDKLMEIAKKEQPKMIIAGASAYSRKIDFKKFKDIANECGAILMVDMAHIAGLVAVGEHMNPCLYADVVTSTTHKTLRGPRGGLILSNDEEIMTKINKMVFPGIQGGPLMHVIGAKAQCFYEALQPEFKAYIENVVKNASSFAKALEKENFKIVSSGTDNHLMLIDTYTTYGITGKEAEAVLDAIHITVNKNTIPNDPLSPMVTSGIRVGTAAMTTRGFTTKEFNFVAAAISEALKNKDDEKILKELSESVVELTSNFPINF
ncbi:MAG: serine hydroxymethyltransferase [bacterium]